MNLPAISTRTIVAGGIVVLVVLQRVYGAFSGFRASQRRREAEPSPVQGLFGSTEPEAQSAPSEIQSLFSNKDAD